MCKCGVEACCFIVQLILEKQLVQTRWMCTICVKKFENSFQNHSSWNFFTHSVSPRLVCIRNSDTNQVLTSKKNSDMYHKILICIKKNIRNFWYISEKSDIYQKNLICIRNFWYVSEISDMYHKILICIIKFWYVSEISDTYFFQDASEISDIVQKQTTNAYCKAHLKKITWAAGSRQP